MLVVAVAVRAFYLWQISRAPFFDLRMGDGVGYHEWGTRIAKGESLDAAVAIARQ